jgi:hypothetical protein
MPRFVIENMKVLDDNTNTYQWEPVSVEEIKEDLQLSGNDFDKTLTRLAKASRQMLENHYNLSLAPKLVKVLMFVPSAQNLVPLPLSPVAAIVGIRFKEPCGCGDWRVLTEGEDADFYLMDDQHLKVTMHGFYEITYTTAAFNNETMLYGIIRQAGYMFSQRDTVAGISINPMLFSSTTAISPLVETSCSQFSRARF